ncbi:MAG TPA: hypothetical protein VFO29_12030 [Candidatus Rubrimentiphilum sp.]|nr:hypothetical protein [Candidatus Rubrimentiphilum sp.]
MRVPCVLAIALIFSVAPVIAAPPPQPVPGAATCTMGFTPNPAMIDSVGIAASYTCTDNYPTSGGCQSGFQADWEGSHASVYVMAGIVRMIYACRNPYPSQYGWKYTCGNQPAFSTQDWTGGYLCVSVPLSCSPSMVASATKAQQIPDTFQYTCKRVTRT